MYTKLLRKIVWKIEAGFTAGHCSGTPSPPTGHCVSTQEIFENQFNFKPLN